MPLPLSFTLLPEHMTQALSGCLDGVMRAMTDALFMITPEGKIQFINPAALALLGYTEADLIDRSIAALLMDDLFLSEPEWEVLRYTGLLRGIERRFTTRTGQIVPVLLSCVLTQSGRTAPQWLVCVAQDLTQQKQIATALKRYEFLSQHAHDIVLFLRPDGQIVDANAAAVQAYHYSREELLTLTLFDLHDSSSAALIHDQIAQAAEKDLLFEATHRRKDSSVFAVEVSIQGAEIDHELLLLGIIRDITTRKRAEEKLFRSAFHDALTNLPNRSLFLERLRRALQQTKQQEDYCFAVLFLDLDRFKVINDSLGHLAGDQLLVAIAQRLSACLKPEDTLARFGGDEFTILLENIQGLNDATQIAERIHRELSHPFKLSNQDVYTSTSIGIVLSTIAWTQPEEFIRSADTALYRSKALGGTRYVVFDADMHRDALNRLHLETDLRRALADVPFGKLPSMLSTSLPHPEFLIYYQPIVSLKTLRICGFEALLRWQHPERGLVSPQEFIPIAEETALILPIGWVALRQACQQLQRWQTQFPSNPPLWVSVNLSVKQFSQLNLVAQIRQVLQETGVHPANLKLEITESVIMENPEAATHMLHELQALGVQLALDDFGTGYSSLAYLHRFPIHTLKIDRSFIQRVDTDGEQLEIVRTIVTLAWNIGIDVVAEGVETNRQLAQLRSLRCEYGQGYLFSKPVPSDAATALIDPA